MNFKSIFYLFIAASVAISLQAAAPGDTIHKAARRGDSAAVQGFIETNPALIDKPDEKSETPLYCATYFDQEAVVRVLLDHGANVNQPDSLGRTPLHCAIRLDHKAVIRAVLDHGADVNQPDSWGQTPLHYAALTGHKAVVKTLEAWPVMQQHKRAAQLAIMSAALPRPGANSPLQGLSKDVLENIARYLRTEDFSAVTQQPRMQVAFAGVLAGVWRRLSHR